MIFNVWRLDGMHEPYPAQETERKTPAPKSSEPISAFFYSKEFEPQTFHPLSEKDDQLEQTIEKHKESLAPIRAGHIMTFPVKCLHPETPLKEAWKLVCNMRFRHVPVVDQEGTLVGILSDRDLLREAVRIAKVKSGNKEVDSKLDVSTVMHPQVISAKVETELIHIAKLFVERRIGAMPIIDRTNQVVGIITRSDILKTIVKICALKAEPI